MALARSVSRRRAVELRPRPAPVPEVVPEREPVPEPEPEPAPVVAHVRSLAKALRSFAVFQGGSDAWLDNRSPAAGVSDHDKREPAAISIKTVKRVVAKYYNIELIEMTSARRTMKVVLPRQVAMYIAKTLTPRSLPHIGYYFGGRDHTTVLHAVRKIEELRKTDAKLDDDLRFLMSMLAEPEAG